LKETIKYNMRCLYCGKGLPLLKRLSRGEFCSEEHRQNYQQEYSQLALNRLLQSQPAEESAKLGSKPGSKQGAKHGPGPAPKQESVSSLAGPSPNENSGIIATERAMPRSSAESRTGAPLAQRIPTDSPAGATLSLRTSQERKRIPTLGSAPAPATIKPQLTPPPLTPHRSIVPQAVSPHMPLPEEKSSHEPKISLTRSQARTLVPVPGATSSATLQITETATSKQGLPTAKRWPSRKSDIATLGLALTSQRTKEVFSHADSVVHTNPEVATPADLRADLPADLRVDLQRATPEVAEHSATPPLAAETLPTAAEPEPLAPALAVEPVPQQGEVASPAPLANCVYVLPPVADAKFEARTSATTDLPWAEGPSMPHGGFLPSVPHLPTAECLSSSTFVDALKAPWRALPVGAEFRDFARRELVFEFRSTIQGPRMDVAAQPAALLFTPVTSGAAIALWIGPSLEFPAIADHSNAVAALDSCFSEAERPSDSPISGAVRSAAARKVPALPERSDASEAAADSHDPGPVLAPFPMVLEGTAGGRAKLVQVFTATLRAAAVVDIPRYEALPLRPVMVLETSEVA
jgi:hypothetical protein